MIFADAPERELLEMMLTDAIEIIRGKRHYYIPHAIAHRLNIDKPQITLRKETISWMAGYNDGWIFSFRNVCELLGLDPTYIRDKVFAEAGITSRVKIFKRSQPTFIGSSRGGQENEGDWIGMYKLGSSLFMGGYREKPL